MFEKVKELILEALEVEEEKITMDANFKEDLGIDSLDLFEMVMSVEDEFGIEIPSEDLEKISTVGQLVAYMQEKQ